jgi:ABC-type nitrate/sulfonate/bicarbonate transport system permease component
VSSVVSNSRVRVDAPSLTAARVDPPASTRSVGRRAFRRVARASLALWLPIALVAIWYLTSRSSTDLYYPPLGQIINSIRTEWLGGGHIASDLWPSVYSLIAGLAISVAVGVALGYLLGMVRPAQQVMAPVLDLFRSAPALALIPIFISVFGIGTESEVLLIAWVCVWPILLNTIDGVAGIDPAYHDVARTSRLGAMRRFSLVGFPAASPQIMAGINTSIGLGVAAMVALEMYSSQRGIGFQLVNAQRNFDIRGAYAGAIVAGVVGYLVAICFLLVQRRMLSWHLARGAHNTSKP